ncbi:MAG: GntR family transcriptional regulator [Lachnospiraceae bacterium]|nr:GntR family transcriptional regulator [Lachnospiraceae bacterium]
MFVIDYKDGRPLYEQVISGFKDMILKGVMEKDEAMPSVRSLAMDLSINPNTIQKAYAELEREGWIYTVKGRGSFVLFERNLKDSVVKELKEKINNMAVEAKTLGISKEELLSLVGGAYDKD